MHLTAQLQRRSVNPFFPLPQLSRERKVVWVGPLVGTPHYPRAFRVPNRTRLLSARKEYRHVLHLWGPPAPPLPPGRGKTRGPYALVHLGGARPRPDSRDRRGDSPPFPSGRTEGRTRAPPPGGRPDPRAPPP